MTKNLHAFLEEALRQTADDSLFAIVYSMPKCEWCDKAVDALNQLGYVVDKRDVMKMDMVDLQSFRDTFQTVPQVVIAGQITGGYESTVNFLKELNRQ